MVVSVNAFGEGRASSNEVSIIAASLPTAPLALANDATVTASGIVGLKWTTPTSDGGGSIIDYQISSKIGTGATVAYSILDSGVTTTSYTASSLTADVVYTFKVTARNVVGYGADSSEVDVRAAATPSAPSAPSTSTNTNISVTITWMAP